MGVLPGTTKEVPGKNSGDGNPATAGIKPDSQFGLFNLTGCHDG
jgi:hypothetical protein